MFVHDAAAELWADETVRCVLVPDAHQVQVELRNADGSVAAARLFVRHLATAADGGS